MLTESPERLNIYFTYFILKRSCAQRSFYFEVLWMWPWFSFLVEIQIKRNPPHFYSPTGLSRSQSESICSGQAGERPDPEDGGREDTSPSPEKRNSECSQGEFPPNSRSFKFVKKLLHFRGDYLFKAMKRQKIITWRRGSIKQRGQADISASS